MVHRICLTKRIIPGYGDLEVKLKVHPLDSDRIIIMMPGANGHIDGYAGKYEKIADLLQEREVGAVVRMANQENPALPYPQSMISDLVHVIDYTLSDSVRISNSDYPTLYLMGFSAGAGAIAAVARSCPQVEKILLIAPAMNAGEDDIKRELAHFEGEVYVTIGENDETVPKQSGQIFYDWAKRARLKKLIHVPNCNHQFTGTENGRILSKAPLWAFMRDESYPSSEGGIKLY